MKTITRIYKFEKAQILPIVALLIVGLIAFAALLLDGGAILSNRRTAQAAADAGALAGAKLICEKETEENVEGKAEEFATENKATTAHAEMDGREVTVTTTVTHASFFARIFGEDLLTASADATAGCYIPPITNRLLPIAFYEGTGPVNAVGANCHEDGFCDLHQYDFKDIMDDIRDTEVFNDEGDLQLPLSDIYIISDKTKICEKIEGVFYCTETAKINEDGGNRGFLDFGEVLQNIISDGLTTSIETPIWVNGKPGGNTSAFKYENFIENYPDISGYEGVPARLYYVPIFDKFCYNSCECPPIEEDYTYCKSNFSSYHLNTFSAFVVTCVQQQDKCDFGKCVPSGTNFEYYIPGDDGEPEFHEITLEYPTCPGVLNALVTDPDFKGFNQDKTYAIEGYFVKNISVDEYFTGIDGTVDFGSYIISLSD